MKGYELIKEIEDENIELGTQFVDIYGNIYCWKKYGLMEEANFVKVNESQGEYIPDMSMIIRNSFEIIEEDKPIEELKEIQVNNCMSRYPNNEELMNKINELVKEVNKLKENK